MSMTKNKSEEIIKTDRQYLWHHMTPYKENATPIVAVEGNGSWITDINGRKYLDAMSGLWCVNVGYGREELAQAAYDQLKTLPYFPLSQSHLPAIQLAEKLNEWLEDDYVIFFSNSGSEANETAFKMVRQYHQQNGEPSRYKLISRYRAYHGNSMGALAATGQAVRTGTASTSCMHRSWRGESEPHVRCDRHRELRRRDGQCLCAHTRARASCTPASG